MSYAILEWILLGLLICTGVFAGAVLLREIYRRILRQKLTSDSKTVRELLEAHKKEHFGEINRLMFHLRDNFDQEVVEVVLRDYIKDSDNQTRNHLRELYRFFEFTDNYIRELTSIRWRDRAEAAFVLGLIGDPKAVPHLIARMQDQDEDETNVKMACAQALGMIKDPKAIPSLIQALEDVNQWSSVKVAEMLVHFGERAVPELLKALQNDTNTNQRIWGAQILGAIESTAAVPLLIQRLRDRDANVRIATVEALGRMKSPLAVHSIIDLLLRDPVAEVRSQAATALGNIADEAALTPLINALNDPEYWTRVRAVEALERLGADHTPHLTKLLMFDPRQEVRRRAAQALERLGVLEAKVQELVSTDPDVVAEAKQMLLAVARQGQVQRIQGFLSDPNFKVRSRITEILGECGGPEAEPALLEAAQDSTWVVRIKAINYLAQNPSEATSQVLQQALTESDDLQRPLIVEALKKLNRSQLEHFFPQLLMLIHDDNIEVRKNAVELLGLFEMDETLSALTGCMQDPVAEIRQAAVESLGQIGTERATPVLVNSLKDPDARVRTRSAYHLGQIQDERSVDGLLQALEDADDKGRREIAEALSRFGLDIIYGRLDELMGSDSSAMKVGICWVVGATQDPRAVRLLSFFLQDSLPEVRCAAVGSLGRVDEPQVPGLIASCVQDVNQKVRASVANAFLRLGTAGDYLYNLAELMEDPDRFVRQRSALAVGYVAPANTLEGKLIGLYEKTMEPKESFYFLLGLGLIPSTAAFQYVLPYYHQTEARHSLLALLDQEAEDLRSRLFSNLKLENLNEDVLPEDILDKYVKELQLSQDPEKRAAAINALEVLAVPEALPYLLDSLSTDPEASIREQAARSLQYLASQLPGLQPRIQTALLQATQDPVPEVSLAALQSMEGVVDRKANPRLFELLNTRSKAIQKAAMHVLAWINQDDITELVELIQNSDDEDKQRRAVFCMRNIQAEGTLGFLESMLHSSVRSLRASAVRALEGHREHPSTLQLMRNCLKDPAGEVRFWTLHGLSEYEDMGLLPDFLSTRQDPDPRVRIEMLRAIARLEHLPTLEPIKSMLMDPIEEVRQQAFFSLLQLSTLDSLRSFQHHFPQTPPGFRENFLPLANDQQVIEFPRHALQTAPDPEHRLVALRSIVLLDPEASRDAVYLRCLSDPSPEIRREAAKALIQSRDQYPEEVWHQLSQDPDPEIQQMLVQTVS